MMPAGGAKPAYRPRPAAPYSPLSLTEGPQVLAAAPGCRATPIEGSHLADEGAKMATTPTPVRGATSQLRGVSPRPARSVSPRRSASPRVSRQDTREDHEVDRLRAQGASIASQLQDRHAALQRKAQELQELEAGLNQEKQMTIELARAVSAQTSQVRQVEASLTELQQVARVCADEVERLQLEKSELERQIQAAEVETLDAQEQLARMREDRVRRAPMVSRRHSAPALTPSVS